MKLKIPCKTVPFYSNSWCIAYMVGKMMKLAFQRIQRFVIWISQERVMTKILKTAQKFRRRVETEDYIMNALARCPSTFQHGFFSSYLS